MIIAAAVLVLASACDRSVAEEPVVVREWLQVKGLAVEMFELHGFVTFGFSLAKNSALGDRVIVSVRERRKVDEGAPAVFGIYDGPPPVEVDSQDLSGAVVIGQDDMARWVLFVEVLEVESPGVFRGKWVREWGLEGIFDSSRERPPVEN